MTYVDNARNQLGRMIMCHMMADTEPELMAMARKLSLNPKWFQGDHFDICLKNRARAIEFGAIEVTSRYLVRMRQERRGRS